MLKDRLLKAFGGLIALATIAFASLPGDALGVSASNEFGDAGYYPFFSVDDIPDAYVSGFVTCFPSQDNWSLPYGERYSYIPESISFSYSDGTYTLNSVNLLCCSVNMFYSTSVDYFFTHYIPFGVYIEAGYSCFEIGCKFEPVSYSGETYSFSWTTWDSNWCIPTINCYTPSSAPSGFYMPWSFLDSFFVSGPTPWIERNAPLYDAGYGDGYSVGYDDGFSNGYADGYKDGYIDGLKAGPSGSQPAVSVSSASHVAFTKVNPLYDLYFDKTRDVTGWTLLSSNMTIYDYDYRSLAFYAAFSISGITVDLGSMYMFRFVGDEEGYVSLYYMKYISGSYTQYNYDFSLYVDWVDESSCVRVTWWKFGADSTVLADNPSCAYYCYMPSALSYEIPDDKMMLSYQPNVVFMATYDSQPVAINLPTMAFSGHWAAPGFADTFDYDSGYTDGYTKGYNDAMAEAQVTIYDSAYADGWNDAAANGAGGAQVIDIWPLLSAVITMPFTFFSTGLDWTLFEGTPYEFGVSAFFGSLLVILMLWKIIQLIMGFGK